MSATSELLNKLIGKVNASVKTEAQTLTEAQKAQARANIGAISEVDVPKKGTDYWTPADQEAIVQDVITALGTPVFGRVDADNNIILTGELAEGSYTITYEDGEGKAVEIGTLDIGGSITNVIPLAINADGTLYNGGKGYKAGYRLNSSGTETAQDGICVTGFIPVKYGDVIRLKDVQMQPYASATNYNRVYVWAYKSDFSILAGNASITGNNNAFPTTEYVIKDGAGNITQFSILSHPYVWAVDISNVAYIRISAQSITDNSIITINEPIE